MVRALRPAPPAGSIGRPKPPPAVGRIAASCAMGTGDRAKVTTLGDDVLRALQKNQPGNGVIAGLAIVFLAIIIDRLTQSIGAENRKRLAAG